MVSPVFPPLLVVEAFLLCFYRMELRVGGHLPLSSQTVFFWRPPGAAPSHPPQNIALFHLPLNNVNKREWNNVCMYTVNV